MLPKPFTEELDLEETTAFDNVAVDTDEGTHIATTELRIHGSVHASGEATLEVDDVYGQLNNTGAFVIEGSVHQSGTHTVDIGSEHSIQVPSESELPPAEGFTSVMENRLDMKQETVFIDSLVLFDEDTPALAKVLDEVGYDCYDVVDLNGAVHEVGKISVHIGKVFILD